MAEELLGRRLGRFSIDERRLRMQPEVCMAIFSADLVILDVQRNWDTMTCDYIAVSPHFKPVPSGEEAPWYVPEIRKSEGEVYEVTWR